MATFISKVLRNWEMGILITRQQWMAGIKIGHSAWWWWWWGWVGKKKNAFLSPQTKHKHPGEKREKLMKSYFLALTKRHVIVIQGYKTDKNESFFSPAPLPTSLTFTMAEITFIDGRKCDQFKEKWIASERQFKL